MTRLFVAIDLPDTVKNLLGDICSGVSGAKWVQREQMHLTLRFIGEVDDAQFAKIGDALGTIQSAPFTLRLQGVGQFPPKGTPRVLWVGVKAPGNLFELQRQVESAIVELGFEAEDRPFSAHITLARLRTPPAPESVRQYFAQHKDFETEEIAVREFVLYSSFLGREGANYRHEGGYSLGG